MDSTFLSTSTFLFFKRFDSTVACASYRHRQLLFFSAFFVTFLSQSCLGPRSLPCLLLVFWPFRFCLSLLNLFCSCFLLFLWLFVFWLSLFAFPAFSSFYCFPFLSLSFLFCFCLFLALSVFSFCCFSLFSFCDFAL